MQEFHPKRGFGNLRGSTTERRVDKGLVERYLSVNITFLENFSLAVSEEKDKIMIAKPVACRPRLSNLKTFSELISIEIDASSSVAFIEIDVAVIIPITARFKPVSSAEASETAPESNIGCNMGGSSIAPMQEVGGFGNAILSSYQVTQNFPTQTEQRVNPIVENHAEETKSAIPANSKDRPLYYGHNCNVASLRWLPLTYLNPPLLSGIGIGNECKEDTHRLSYKGGHNYLKPQPPNHTPSENQQAEVNASNKFDNGSLRGGMVGEASSDPVVQNNVDSGLIGDGFRWRKYGQKVVIGRLEYTKIQLG
ncbi:hypothetical protein OROMI_017350 [Orobanche minor]